MTPWMQVTCRCGWDGRRISDIFRYSALQNPGNA